MIKQKLTSDIMSAMKAGDKIRLEALRAVKKAFQDWETAKENVGKTLEYPIQVAQIQKLISQYKDTVRLCNTDGKHDALVSEANQTIAVLESMLPETVSEGTILECFVELKNSGIEAVKRNMKTFISEIKNRYPGADSKTVSQVVLKNLN